MKTIRGDRIILRKPTEADGAAMWRLVRDSSVLDLNSPYAYLMFAKLFSETCVVAEEEGEGVGFVTAFLPPDVPDTVFVWQIGVSEKHRGQGIARRMIQELLRRRACKSARFLEATVSPSNEASNALFMRVAKECGTNCEITECFPARLFPGGAHETEWTYRIGPIHTIS